MPSWYQIDDPEERAVIGDVLCSRKARVNSNLPFTEQQSVLAYRQRVNPFITVGPRCGLQGETLQLGRILAADDGLVLYRNGLNDIGILSRSAAPITAARRGRPQSKGNLRYAQPLPLP